MSSGTRGSRDPVGWAFEGAIRDGKEGERAVRCRCFEDGALCCSMRTENEIKEDCTSEHQERDWLVRKKSFG